MTNLGRSLRTQLTERFSLDRPKVQDCSRSRDGTVKFLLRLTDGCIIESVLIPEKDHTTLCISAQVGCPLGCTFCSTGRMGFQRNLTPSEILGQVLVARDHLQSTGSLLPLRNIVFMGMGEPLLNWPHVRHSLDIIRDPLGLNFSHRRVTVSTVGVPETLEACARSGLASLAVSLHAPDQSLRQELMPQAARLMPLPDLMSALQSVPLKPRQRITIEYILIKGINDSVQQAKDLNRLLSGLKCKINLIAFNPGGGIDLQAPDMEDILRFEQVLWDKGQTVILRKSKGQDIDAACGQLIDKQFNPASGRADRNTKGQPHDHT
jgi:23S rRNA (adenine2503-C2)-methyltransferase